MINTVLFDLDGVLIDTESIYTDFWSEIDMKFPTGVSDFALIIKGNTLDAILAKYFPYPHTQKEVVGLLRDFENNMPFVLFDGAEKLLNDLRKASIKTAIVTSSNRAKMSRVFSELPVLANSIDILITDEDVVNSKPHPEGYLLAAAKLGALPDSFCVVEDSIAGLKAGRASGGRVIGLATTNPREVISPIADFVADNIGQLSVNDFLK